MAFRDDEQDQVRSEQLVEDGFVVCEAVLSSQMIDRLRVATDRVLETYSDEQKASSGHQGSIVGMEFQDPVFQELIAWPGSLQALGRLSFDRPRYWSAFIISKEPHAPQTYWHQDWPYWGEATSYEALPHQLFLMFYLIDTYPENGCLRAIPGSHRHRQPVHDFLGTGHEDDIRHQDPETSPAYAAYPDQVDVPVRAGDLVIGDARLLHATNPNRTDQRRTVITMWYIPRYEELSEGLLAAYQSNLFVSPPDSLPADQLALVQPLLPDYAGGATPTAWDRIPARFLQD